ncbi:MAG: hypothetical protein HZA54_03560 [Planctomycetes bacterium]|nr:hypothetical protein [Planctomycetota bacterium]
MGYKKTRLGRFLAAPEAALRYGDVHVAIGGTGAVGGTALLKMLALYEEMMALRRPAPEQVPVLVATGRTSMERRLFTTRLFRFVESRHGRDANPAKVRNGYLTHTGVFFALEDFELAALPGLDRIAATARPERPAYVRAYLDSLGCAAGAGSVPGTPDPQAVHAAMRRAIAAGRPFSPFLERYRAERFGDRPDFRYRSVLIGIPLPSLAAYHCDGLDIAGKLLGFTPDQSDGLKDALLTAIRDDLARVQSGMADNVVVAHTTSVGGMYDERVGEDGRPHRTIRLGFAHSAQDELLVAKQKFADRLTELYGEAGVKTLITAAAIGVDEVRIRKTIPVHRKVAQMLFDAAGDGSEVFAGSRQAPVVHVFAPLAVPLDDPPSGPARFPALSACPALRPSYAIRSGENGFFSVANADALYRVMRVASASELGLVMAQVCLFGDDPQAPWFDEKKVCYYTETDNARAVFDFLAQPGLRAAQLSGLEPMALQDLGSAKHQGELHTLGLLILLHRLRTLDVEAIPAYVDIERFDAQTFFEERSRPLAFEDVCGWDVAELARDLAVLVSADSAKDLTPLKPFRAPGHDLLFPEKEAARLAVLDTVLRAVRAVTSLGSPILYEQDGRSWLRHGYFVAPLDLVVRRTDDVARWFSERQAAQGGRSTPEDLRDFHVCVGGFVDLRPHALVCTAKNDREPLAGRVLRARDEAGLRAALAAVEPYGFFATAGLVALCFRLRALAGLLLESLLELGTMQDWLWQMPRDASGHILLVPGVVEALRMVSEGLEKTTGTSALDGLWGYERRPAPDRRGEVAFRKGETRRVTPFNGV